MDEEVAKVFKEFFSNLIEYTGGTITFSTILLTFFVIFIVLGIAIFIFYKVRKNIKERNLREQEENKAVSIVEEKYNSNAEDFTESLETYKTLVSDCVHLGEQIDIYTERKSNSRIVSSLVYKISEELNLGAQECILNYCTSFVYDVGFLDVPQDLFSAEILSKTEISVIKTHVMRAEDYFNFVPENFKMYFFNAYYLHHENINGTGYPESLSGEDIPLIARILRAVESFVSLTSKRSYHKIMPRNDAVNELKKHPEIYDSNVVNALYKVL